MPISHDQNFKNLILDFPREALAFFAPQSAARLAPDVEITPIRQEQLKDRLGDRFYELDVPLQVTARDGSHEAVIFLFEEESNPHRFSIHRLGIYCLQLAELLVTTRVVPIVIFLKGSPGIPRQLALGDEVHTFMNFDYIGHVMDQMPATRFIDSPNFVARITMTTMHVPSQDRFAVHASALEAIPVPVGPDGQPNEPEATKRLKYIDFINHYLPLSPAELPAYARRYPKEHHIMTTWSERFIEQGKQQGLQQGLAEGVEQGKQQMLLRLLTKRFGTLDNASLKRIQGASTDELDRWFDQALDAQSLPEVFQPH